MRAAIKLEHIGANTDAMGRLFGYYNGPWVAEIVGGDPRYKYLRLFLRPNVNYRDANSVGSRGVYNWYMLEYGKCYQVHERTSWRSSDRYFCTVDKFGDVTRLDEGEVRAWLKSL